MKDANSSMQLTRAADYAIRVMIHMVGQGSDRRVSLPALAAATTTPESFLSKVLQALTRAGLLVSQRGQSGGFTVTRRGRESSILDVIEAVDGPIRLNLCLSSGSSCPRQAWCPAHPVWAHAQDAMLHVLGSARLQALASGTDLTGQRLAEDFGIADRIATASRPEKASSCSVPPTHS